MNHTIAKYPQHIRTPPSTSRTSGWEKLFTATNATTDATALPRSGRQVVWSRSLRRTGVPCTHHARHGTSQSDSAIEYADATPVAPWGMPAIQATRVTTVSAHVIR